ncbi:hypothetical protein AAG570_003483 [Ranatra chinensis]|uniref:Uncharacterized protein n=1 Tax=Ranatra chinensis TaxID=642074 RepID=A0ABD0YI88_9HEMI
MFHKNKKQETTKIDFVVKLVRGSAGNSNIDRIQSFQSKILRTILDEPWYVSYTLHTDLNIPTVRQVFPYPVLELDVPVDGPKRLRTRVVHHLEPIPVASRSALYLPSITRYSCRTTDSGSWGNQGSVPGVKWKRPRVWRPERRLGGVLRVRGGTVWFPAVGGLPLREDPGAAPPRGPRAASRLAEPSCPPDHTPQFGSTFGVGCPKREPDSPRPPPPAVRGGVQVLPPTLPPRTKPKPPLPPKRDELTRLTTVRREQPHRPPHADFPQDDTAESKRYETPETPPPFVQEKKSDDSYFQYDKNPERVSSPVWKLGDNVVEHVLRRNDSFHNRPHHSQGQLLSETNIHPGGDNSASRERAREPPANFEDRLTVESKVNFLENLERQNSARKNPPKDTPPETVNGQVNSRPPVTKSEALPPPPPPEPDPSDYPECLYATINPETKRHHAAEKQSAEDKKPVYAEPVPPPPPPSETFSEASDDSRREDDREESSDSEEGATADIWVRAIDSPVKKPPGQVRNPSVETEQQKPDPKPHIVIENKDGGKVGSESLPCSRPSSRTASRSSSPALFCEKGGEKQSGSKQRISAAEALGVVAKPCPRPPPGNRMKNALEFRRQSLSNLSDSKLSVGSSATSQQLWSSFGECQEYRRHERTRGQSADSRTLQRLRAADGGASTPPAWDNYSSTLSRIGKYAKSSERAATTGGDRPKSTCSCGQHSVQPALPQPPPPPATVPREVGKRTFSVEELTTGRGDFVRGSSRSSLGKSPRVTFALSEDEMGAAGGGDPPRKPIRTSRPTQQDDRYFPHQRLSQNIRNHIWHKPSTPIPRAIKFLYLEHMAVTLPPP